MENKTGKYFKYAIGEIVLVVIGILIALQINNWNENRKIDKVRQDYYGQLLEDLNKRELAIESAKKSLIIAEKIQSEPYKKMNLENIKKWNKQ